jgi:type VI secretion system protein ImpH
MNPIQDSSLNGGPAPDMFTTLRRLERHAGRKPKIGLGTVMRDDIATLGQDPFTAFPGRNLTEIRQGPDGVPDLRVRFLGLFGPQGPLPLTTTVEVEGWVREGDRAFVDFADVLTTRFLQLFYRAWSDSKPITQMDHPERDRFQDFVASLAGFGTSAMQNRGVVSDLVRQDLVPLMVGRVTSTAALRQMLEHVIDMPVRIEEFVPMRLEFEREDQSRLGQQGNALGRSIHLGAGVTSVGNRICIHVRVQNADEYFRFLPSGDQYAVLADLVQAYSGQSIDALIALRMPREKVPPARIGQMAYLGWMAAIPRQATDTPDENTDDPMALDVEVGRFRLVPPEPERKARATPGYAAKPPN